MKNHSHHHSFVQKYRVYLFVSHHMRTSLILIVNHTHHALFTNINPVPIGIQHPAFSISAVLLHSKTYLLVKEPHHIHSIDVSFECLSLSLINLRISVFVSIFEL